MPSYAQLQSEVWWANEFQPPSLAELCRNLRGYFQVGAAALGSKGDNNHLYGYHRSRAWVLSSRWSAYGAGDYSVQAAEDRGGDNNWLAAVDFTPGDTDTMITVCQRLDAAVKAGKTPQLREWYGNVDGDQVVDGWDLLYDRAATSDSSHLWHLHMSFLRSRANDDHSNLYAILTGATPATTSNEEDDVKAWLAQDSSGIAVVWTGATDVLWRNIAAIESVAAWNAAGVPGPFAVPSIGALGSPAPVAVGGGGGGPSRDELTQAAFEGAQRAERE